jgi:uncharacterized protein with GYD domain
MSTYLMFGRYSMEAVKAISAKRTEKSIALIKQNGGELVSGYALLGKTDLLLIVNFPDLKSAMKTSVALSKLLAIAFVTQPAVSMAEFDKLLE